MQERDAVPEARDEPRDHLCREDDLWHEDDHAVAAGERRRGRAKVHLGLAAGRDPVKKKAATRAERPRDGPDRDGLRPRRREVARPVLVGERELSGYSPHGSRPYQHEPATREGSRCHCRTASVREIAPRHGAGGEGPKRRELPRAHANRPRERVSSGCLEREDRLRPLPASAREARRPRPGCERRRDHRADRVGETAAVPLGDPGRERELVRSEERERVHEGVDRPEVAPRRRAIKRDDDAGNGARPETHADEVPRQELEPVGDEVAEGAGGPAHSREDGDLRGPCGHRSYLRCAPATCDRLTQALTGRSVAVSSSPFG